MKIAKNGRSGLKRFFDSNCFLQMKTGGHQEQTAKHSFFSSLFPKLKPFHGVSIWACDLLVLERIWCWRLFFHNFLGVMWSSCTLTDSSRGRGKLNFGDESLYLVGSCGRVPTGQSIIKY